MNHSHHPYMSNSTDGQSPSRSNNQPPHNLNNSSERMEQQGSNLSSLSLLVHAANDAGRMQAQNPAGFAGHLPSNSTTNNTTNAPHNGNPDDISNPQLSQEMILRYLAQQQQQQQQQENESQLQRRLLHSYLEQQQLLQLMNSQSSKTGESIRHVNSYLNSNPKLSAWNTTPNHNNSNNNNNNMSNNGYSNGYNLSQYALDGNHEDVLLKAYRNEMNLVRKTPFLKVFERPFKIWFVYRLHQTMVAFLLVMALENLPPCLIPIAVAIVVRFIRFYRCHCHHRRQIITILLLRMSRITMDC